MLCRSASVYLLGSEVYLHETVAPFLHAALNSLHPPSWLSLPHNRDTSGDVERGGGVCVEGINIDRSH